PPPQPPHFPYTTLFRSSPLSSGQPKMAGIGSGIGEIFGAPIFIMRQSVQSGRQFDQIRLDCGIMRIGGLGRWREKSERGVVVMRSEEHTSELQSLRHLV